MEKPKLIYAFELFQLNRNALYPNLS